MKDVAFFEACTRLGRIDNKDCIYGNKADKDKRESQEDESEAADDREQ